MAQRYTMKTSFTATEEMFSNLEAVAKRFNTPVSEIVRDCVEAYLPTLVNTYKEREQNLIEELDLDDE
ncbi:MAG: hypothetical protein OXT74_02720 [Candidatus Poribacteria bacterium]|nr:hypothetical protein [Candidatus Poribacteria bacterium]